MEESSVALGSWNCCLTNSGFYDNFPATQYGMSADFPFCGPIYPESTHTAEASVVDKILSCVWMIPT
jgi:hypothetical protein